MKRTLCAALCALLAATCPTAALAQTGATADYWDGNVISDKKNSYFAPEELADDNLFLYNVGTGLWLYIGGDWGTRATLSSIGKPLTFAKYTSGNTAKYGITASFKNDGGSGQGSNLGVMLSGEDKGNAYWDRAFNANTDLNSTFWKFELIDADNRRYAFSSSPTLDSKDAHYLVAEDDKINSYGHIMTTSTDTKPGKTALNGLWKIVTRDDLIKNFNNTYTRSGEPSNASFLLRAENFNAKNSNVGKFWSQEPAKSMTATVGIGKEDGTDDPYKKAFYRYYNLGITEAQKGSAYVQVIEMEQPGWYRIDCQGLYSMAAGEGSAAAPVLFAIVADENGSYTNFDSSTAYSAATALRYADNPSSPLPTLEQVPADVKAQLTKLGIGSLTPANVADNQLLAGISFYPNSNNGYKGSYANELAFCVPGASKENKRKVKVGIYFPEAQQKGDYVFADIFMVKFLGEDFVITEDALPANHNNYSERALTLDGTYAPAAGQHKRQMRRTLILKRHFDEGVWNSITLPISLTKAQVANAFGAGTQLAKLDQLTNNGYTIHFNHVDLSENVEADEIVLEAGKIYVIKPTRKPLTGGYTALDQNKTELKKTDKFYVIDRMSLGYKEDASGENGLSEIEVAEPEVYPADNEFGKLRFTASYNKVGVYAGSYVFSKGNLYHLASPVLMKGLRGYVSLIDEADQASAPQLSFCIDGIDETTGISGIGIEGAGIEDAETEAVYYRLDGTRAGRASQLGRGLYIAKGRKILVK